MLCYLFKNQVNGFINGSPIDCIGKAQSECGSDTDKNTNLRKIEPQKPTDIVKRFSNDDKDSIGVELRKRFPDPTPSTEKQLNIVRSKPPINEKVLSGQSSGISTQDSMIFRPFDEIWNPGYMPLDLVFGGVNKMMPGPDARQVNQGPDPSQMNQGSMMTGPKNIAQGVMEDLKLILVYAPWCGHSKKMLPDFEKVKSEFHGQVINGKRIHVIMYNSDVDKDMVKEYGAKGFPALFVEKNGSRESFPHRTYDKISEYLKNI